MTKFIRVACATAASAVAALAPITIAWGHAHPDTTTPAKGAVLQTAPAKVDIMFVEEIQKTAGTDGIDVALDGGSSVTSGVATIDPSNAAHLSVALKPSLSGGRYVVNWHNVSSVDGDAAEGAFSFYVKVQPTAADLAKDAELANVGMEPMATETAMPMGEATVIAPAPAMSPMAPSGGAAPSAALPRTGDGSGARGGRGWRFLIAATAVAGLAVIGAAAAFTMRQER